MRFFDEVFGKITANANLTGTIGKTTNYECYRDSIRELEYSCGKANTYSMKYFKYLYEMCEDKYELSTEQIFAKVHDACEQTM